MSEGLSGDVTETSNAADKPLSQLATNMSAGCDLYLSLWHIDEQCRGGLLSHSNFYMPKQNYTAKINAHHAHIETITVTFILSLYVGSLHHYSNYYPV